MDTAESRRPAAATAVTAVVVVIASIGGALADSAPSGSDPADTVYRVVFAGGLALLGSTSRPWSWLWISAGAGAAAGFTAAGLPALLALAMAFAAALLNRTDGVIGAAVVGLAAQSLLRLDLPDPHGLATVVAFACALPVLVSGLAGANRWVRRVWFVGGSIFMLAVLAGAAVLGMGAFTARSAVNDGITEARRGFDAARAGEEAEAVAQFDTAATELAAASADLEGPALTLARQLPVIGQHVTALQDVTEEGQALAEVAGSATAEAPLEELGFEDGSLDLELVAAFDAPLTRVADALAQADATAEQVASPWLVGPLADRIDEFRNEVAETLPDAEIARDGIALAPDLFGGGGVRRYLLAFVTPAEARGLNGFIGNFGVLTADGGSVDLTRSNEITELARVSMAAGATITEPEDYVRRYQRFRPEEFPGDLSLSPDLPSVASAFEQVFTQSGGPPVDGVIMIDPHGLQGLMHFTGPIQLENTDVVLTEDNAADFLLREQYLSFDGRADRKDFLEEASRLTFERLTSGDLPGPREVTDVLGPLVAEGRIAVHSFDDAERAFFGGVGLGGAFPNRPETGDVIGFTNQNSGHNKIDNFLRAELDYTSTVDRPAARVTATATATLHNESPTSGLPEVLIGNTSQGQFPSEPLGTNRMFFSLYTSLILESLTVADLPIPVEADIELGVNVYSAFISIPPGASADVVAELAGPLEDPEATYELTVVRQPRVQPGPAQVTLDDSAAGEPQTFDAPDDRRVWTVRSG